MKRRDDADRILDHAVEQIRARHLPADETEEIAGRVWQKLSRADSAALAVDDLAPIRDCDDYQALIPAFLDDTLSRPRRLLLESHLRECVPCRKAMRAARAGQPAAPSRPRARSRVAWGRWAVAAALAAGIGLGLYWMTALRAFEGRAAVVAESPGEIYRVADAGSEALGRGAGIAYGERIRTGRGESALLRLEDGSQIEVRERSWLAVRANRRGTTIDLERGSVIVEAAPQGARHLFVATGDCLVAVKGTIFSVDHGTKGSRVSVIEGEVSVDAGGVERLLQPGEQTVTHSSLAPIPVAQDISWSRDVDRYLELMGEVSALRRALAEGVPRPQLRYSSRLLALVPTDTVFFVALPNLAETIAEADRILRERIADSRLLRQWLASRDGMDRFGPEFADLTQRLAELGRYLGDEVLVTARLEAGGETGHEMGRPLVLAELRDAAGLRRFVESEMARHGEGDAGSVAFLEPGGESPAGPADLYVWMSDDTLLAATDLDALKQTLGGRDGSVGSFAATPFGRRVQAAYADGAGVLIAADLRHVVASRANLGEPDRGRDALAATGLLKAEHLLLEQKWVGGRTQHRAVLAFDGPRQGMMAWLAEPGPMGSLEFISPDAKFATAMLLVDPSVLVGDLMRWTVGGEDTSRQRLEETLGVDLEHDLGAAFGGEIALAIDGPLLPEPSWKVVVEVYDPDRAMWIVGQLVDAVNAARAEEGEEPISLNREEAGGRTFWSLDGARPVHLTFEAGYLLVAPSRALLDRAIRYRTSGYTLAASSRFRGLLPTDGRDNFSAIFYQDAMGLLEPLAERIATRDLTPEQRRTLESLAAESGPSLGYAYGEPERIVFAASSTMSLLDAGLPALLGLGNPFDLGGLIDAVAKATPRGGVGSAR